MRASQTGIDLIKHFEGLRLESYQDIAGIWTIGYGHTGPEVQAGQVISESEAEDLLRQDLSRFEDGVSRSVKVDIDQNQFDALVSLSYNIGLAAFKGSTALRLLNSGDYLGAAEAITWWNKATVNGVKREVLGLTRRRAAEAALFLQDVGAGEAGPADDDSTRVTPEENMPRRGNLAGSRTVEGSVIAGAAGAAGAGATMIDGDDSEATETPVQPSDTPPADTTSAEVEPETVPAPTPETDTGSETSPPAENPEATTTEVATPPPEEATSTEAEPEIIPAPVPETEARPETLPPAENSEATTTQVGTPAPEEATISREEYKESIQIVAGVIVVVAVLYIIWARIDDWLNFRR